jgi:apolipoprotein D and lipocalin family protein
MHKNYIIYMGDSLAVAADALLMSAAVQKASQAAYWRMAFASMRQDSFNAYVVLFVMMLSAAHSAPLSIASLADACVNAAPASNFSNSAYVGTWFEVAKYQTAGGSFFERNCVCTEVQVSPLPAPSPDFHAHFSCRDKLPSGK